MKGFISAFVLFFFFHSVNGQGVAINGDNSQVNSFADMDVTTISNRLLDPRMSSPILRIVLADERPFISDHTTTGVWSQKTSNKVIQLTENFYNSNQKTLSFAGLELLRSGQIENLNKQIDSNGGGSCLTSLQLHNTIIRF